MKRTERISALILTLVMCIGLCAPASAKQTVLQYHTEPISSGGAERLQESWSSLYVDSDSSSWASAWLRSKDGTALPAGSLGIESRLYNDDGELCASTGMRYNTSEASFVAGVTSASSDGYCSWGHTRSTYFEEEGFTVANAHRLTSGDDFVFSPELGNFKFPEKLLKMLKGNEDGYPTNSAGEPYGSALLTDYNRKYWESPVLLSAVGTNGVRGYVREADLNPYVATRQDAVDYMSKLEENRVLPLYDKDGKTVIGTFILDGSFTSGTTEKELESAKAAAAAKPGAETRQSVKLPETKAEIATLVERSEANCPYQRTSKGETYGPDNSFGEVGYNPVWIPAVSTEDDEGFIRSKDLLTGGPGTYPVYDMEGKVIGEFVIKKFEPPAGYNPNMSLDEAKALVKEG